MGFHDYTDLGDVDSDKIMHTAQDRSYFDPKTVLEKAISKAIENGWDVFGCGNHQFEVHFADNNEVAEDLDLPMAGLWIEFRRTGMRNPEAVIFNHDFAKSLWGEDKQDSEE